MIPLVTCICPTTEARRPRLIDAVRSFLEQDYPHKRLIVGHDARERKIGHFSLPVDYRITETWLPPLSLGEKRNRLCSMATGEYLATWDDDDYSSPGRLSDQVSIAAEANLDAVAYSSCVVREERKVFVLDGSSRRETSGWWVLSVPSGECIGSSLLVRRGWILSHPYPPLNVGEDNGAWAALSSSGRAAIVSGADFLRVVNHHRNTSGRLVEIGNGWHELPGDPWLEAKQ